MDIKNYLLKQKHSILQVTDTLDSVKTVVVKEEEANELSKKGVQIFKNVDTSIDDGVVTTYYYFEDDPLTDEEFARLVALKQAEDINTIRKYTKFFVTLTVISIIVSIVAGIFSVYSVKKLLSNSLSGGNTSVYTTKSYR